MVTIFFSYSHKDELLRDELEIHLSILKKQGIIETWHDRRIGAGKVLDKEIDTNLEDADIILLLASPYFIASDYCYDIEMKRAMQSHEAGRARVIPVILHPCEWQKTPFGKLRATPTDGKPISKFPNLHDAFLDITRDIRDAAEEINKKKLGNAKIYSTKVNETPVLQITTAKTKETARSSNLRIRRDFTDVEKSRFLLETFEYIVNFFENTLKELEARAIGVEAEFRRIDANHFVAKIFKNGRQINQCKIWLSPDSSAYGDIKYSSDASMRDNSFNCALNVSDDGYTLGLKTFAFYMHDYDENKILSKEGAAELLWSIVMEPLQ